MSRKYVALESMSRNWVGLVRYVMELCMFGINVTAVSKSDIGTSRNYVDLVSMSRNYLSLISVCRGII